MIRQGMPCLSKKLIPLMIIKYRRMQNAQIKDQKWSKKNASKLQLQVKLVAPKPARGME